MTLVHLPLGERAKLSTNQPLPGTGQIVPCLSDVGRKQGTMPDLDEDHGGPRRTLLGDIIWSQELHLPPCGGSLLGAVDSPRGPPNPRHFCKQETGGLE